MEFAVVPEDPALAQNDPAWNHVVSALNIQAAQHAAPAWGLQATVSAFSAPALVPSGFIPVVVMRAPPSGVEGCHKWQNDLPSIVVHWAPDGAWSVAASHEIVETLVDPTLASVRQGPDPEGTAASVDFLVEVCDPCIGITYALSAGAAIQVSDYCLPSYYVREGQSPFTRCGQALSLWSSQAMVSPDGYITWSKSDGWRQLFHDDILGPHTQEELLPNALKFGMRGAVDRFRHFGRPHHLRSRARPRVVKRPAARLFARNLALVAWVAALKQPSTGSRARKAGRKSARARARTRQ